MWSLLLTVGLSPSPYEYGCCTGSFPHRVFLYYLCSQDLNKLAQKVFEEEEYKMEWDKIYENKDNRENTYTSFQLF